MSFLNAHPVSSGQPWHHTLTSNSAGTEKVVWMDVGKHKHIKRKGDMRHRELEEGKGTGQNFVIIF